MDAIFKLTWLTLRTEQLTCSAPMLPRRLSAVLSSSSEVTLGSLRPPSAATMMVTTISSLLTAWLDAFLHSRDDQQASNDMLETTQQAATTISIKQQVLTCGGV